MKDERPVVLIVDDLPLNLQLRAAAFQPHFRIKVATNGPTALDLAHREPLPDVILLDLMMPEMDGYAVKFSPHGGITLRVQLLGRQGPRVSVQFAVEDQGVGVAPEIQSGLFQLFHQGDSSLARKFSGTGLGLALCQRLVRLMGGEIGLTSTPGQGTRVGFRVLLGTVPASPANPRVLRSRLV